MKVIFERKKINLNLRKGKTLCFVIFSSASFIYGRQRCMPASSETLLLIYILFQNKDT